MRGEIEAHAFLASVPAILTGLILGMRLFQVASERSFQRVVLSLVFLFGTSNAHLNHEHLTRRPSHRTSINARQFRDGCRPSRCRIAIDATDF